MKTELNEIFILQERIQNIQLALDGYKKLKQIYKNIKAGV